jgi:hypothetical protein
MTTFELSRRAVACKRWRWMPGMLALDSCNEEHPARVIDARRSVVYEDNDGAIREGVVSRSDVPDLTDPATLGCLLALVREAWGDDRVSSVANTVYGTRMILMPDDAAPEGERLIGCSTTEAEALVIALEAAPSGAGGESTLGSPR